MNTGVHACTCAYTSTPKTHTRHMHRHTFTDTLAQTHAKVHTHVHGHTQTPTSTERFWLVVFVNEGHDPSARRWNQQLFDSPSAIKTQFYFDRRLVFLKRLITESLIVIQSWISELNEGFKTQQLFCRLLHLESNSSAQVRDLKQLFQIYSFPAASYDFIWHMQQFCVFTL